LNLFIALEKLTKNILSILEKTEVLVITAGAGMSADSGIPTYRGENGTWGQLEGEWQIPIRELMTPQFINENPLYMWRRFAKGRLALQNVQPHQGFYILKKWIEEFNWKYFVLTSNVDEMFQKAGFDSGRVFEVHGSGKYLQCTLPCSKSFWLNKIEFDPYKENLSIEELPKCPFCGRLARPNVYIFNDRTYVRSLSKAQKERYQYFLNKNKDRSFLVIEIGAGKKVITIRKHTEKLMSQQKATVLRINPFEAGIDAPHISLPDTALRTLKNLYQNIKILRENA